ncbi:MAG: hypothetical protein KatS3mg076_1074 [Candidatus Binatia bacterium]|nr:MAG: hypothetical protein KatS3mg076_1074 [Candidatus Binatia bacterium]
MKRSVDVKILGQTFTVATDEEEEHIRKVAQLVDARLREASSGGAVSTFRAAILAALNIASDYEKLRLRHAELERALEAIAARLERSLGDSPED